ncbi:kinase-like domain-containing protein [Hypoxylon rubiginosum]|uniref:Kinase-like domain-containing protein n=1 Tax=Hypoxylon rubiginosum TaxID=110542 RepID=A0ACC0CU55_9PEZI|nr:kinase-like domain-containing protein [Hypoxylon rubiginosum]
MSSPDVPTFKDQAEVLAAETTQIFKDNPRFRFVSLIGYGTCGAVFRMRYRDPEQVCEDFIVKRSFDDPEAKQGLQTEANLLKRYRACTHIVNILDIPNNPLNTAAGIDQDSWMALEWLTGGTVGTFLNNAIRKMVGRPIPNRILWRFFLCMMRGCVAISYPDHDERIPGRDVEPSGLVHNDLHIDNIILGDFLTEILAEHEITPIVKIIDFGSAGQMTRNNHHQEVQDRRSMAMIMEKLITQYGRLGTRPRGVTRPDIEFNGETFRCIAPSLVPPPAGVDPELCLIVCALMAEDSRKCPSLPYVLRRAQEEVANPSAFYRDRPEEQDDAIKQLCHEIIHDAPTS